MIRVLPASLHEHRTTLQRLPLPPGSLGSAKWAYSPLGRGFDTYTGYMQGQCNYTSKKINNGFDFWKGTSVDGVVTAAAAWDEEGKVRVRATHPPTTA